MMISKKCFRNNFGIEPTFCNFTFVSVMGPGGESRDGRVQAVLTCSGDIDDPEFPEKCQKMFDRLSQVLHNSKSRHAARPASHNSLLQTSWTSPSASHGTPSKSLSTSRRTRPRGSPRWPRRGTRRCGNSASSPSRWRVARYASSALTPNPPDRHFCRSYL